MIDKPKLTLNAFKNKSNKDAKLFSNNENKDLNSTEQSQVMQKDDSLLDETDSITTSKDLENNHSKEQKSTTRYKPLLTKEEYSAIMKYLQKTYPKCFIAGTAPYPMALGIHKELLQSEVLPCSKVKMRKFLKKYTQSKDYRQNLIIGNPRIDLHGNQVGIVTEEEVNGDKLRDVK